MQLDLHDQELRLLVAGHSLPGWTEPESSHVLLVAQCTIAAQTPSDLHALQILRLHQDPDETVVTSYVRLSAERRLTITFKTDNIPMTAAFDLTSPGTEGPP